jgi:hypothetical protein
MRIGIDFDNTIAGYDDLFVHLGRSRGWLPADFKGGKKRVVEAVRRLDQGETKWMQLQAAAYGAHMDEAKLIDGVGSFLDGCKARRIEVYIVSHKTRQATLDQSGVDLREAALAWMAMKGFFDDAGFALPREHVFFESTRKGKCERIGALRCDHFIDDLEIVFREPFFPVGVNRHLYHPGKGRLPVGPFKAYRSWKEIADGILENV